MTLNNLTTQVDQFIKKHGGYWDLPWLLAALIEELGELSRAIQSLSGLREDLFEKSLEIKVEEESGDLLFALICLTNSLNINLEKALQKSLKKYEKRNFVKLDEMNQ